MRTFTLFMLFVLAITLPSLAQERVRFIQYNVFYSGFFGADALNDSFQQFNANRPWMESPFKEESFRMNVRPLDVSAGLIGPWVRLEVGWKTHRYFFEAYNIINQANADVEQQYVRLKMPAVFIGAGFTLANRRISPGVNLEFGKLQLSTIERGRTVRFNRRNRLFDEALDTGLDTPMTYLNVHVQFRFGDDLEDDFGGYLLIEPYYTLGLREADLAPFDEALNGPAPNQVEAWSPRFFGIKLGIGVFFD